MQFPSGSSSPGSIRPVNRWRWSRPALATFFALLASLGGVVYKRPFWVIREFMHAWLRLAGVRSKYVQLGAFRIHYFVGGRGQPLVLVHGLGANADSWTMLMSSLVRGRQVFAIDLLGFGRSDQPDVDYSISLQVEVLRQFLESQNLTRVDLGGWSMGGWVTLKFALDYPERIRRIFLIDSAGLRFNLLFDAALFQPATTDQAQLLLDRLTPYASRIPRFVASDLVRLMGPTSWVVQRAMQSMIAGGDLLDGKLQAICAPVLVLWGKQDALIPLACGEELHREIPQSLLAILDGCGHLAPLLSSHRLLPEIVRFLEAEPPLPASAREIPV